MLDTGCLILDTCQAGLVVKMGKLWRNFLWLGHPFRETLITLRTLFLTGHEDFNFRHPLETVSALFSLSQAVLQFRAMEAAKS